MVRRLGQLAFAVWSMVWLFVAYVVALFSGLNFGVAVAVCVLSAGACALLAWIRFTATGRERFRSNRASDWVGVVHVVVFLVAFGTAGFAALSTGLYNLGVGSIKGGALEGREVVDAAYSYYLWNLADAVPLVDAPKTLNWKLEHPFTDSVHGSLALTYTVLVVFPLVYVATQFLLGLTTDPKPGKPATDTDEAT